MQCDFFFDNVFHLWTFLIVGYNSTGVQYITVLTKWQNFLSPAIHSIKHKTLWRLVHCGCDCVFCLSSFISIVGIQPVAASPCLSYTTTTQCSLTLKRLGPIHTERQRWLSRWCMLTWTPERYALVSIASFTPSINTSAKSHWVKNFWGVRLFVITRNRFSEWMDKLLKSF